MSIEISMDLREGEEIIRDVKGDYWEGLLGIVFFQNRGHFIFTNQRIVFAKSSLAGLLLMESIDYKDIESINKCMVGPIIPFIPTGVRVKIKTGKKFKFSLLKRQEFMSYLEEQIQKI